MPLVDWFQDPDKVTVELHLGDVNGAIALRVFHRAERPKADERAHHFNASPCVRRLVQRSIARTVSKTRLLRRNFRRKTESPCYRMYHRQSGQNPFSGPCGIYRYSFRARQLPLTKVALDECAGLLTTVENYFRFAGRLGTRQTPMPRR